MSRQVDYSAVVGLLVFLLFSIQLLGQDITTFSRTYDFNYGVESGLTVLPVEGGYFIAGVGSASEYEGWPSLKLTMTDSIGNVIWKKVYGQNGKVTSGGWYNGLVKLDKGYFLAASVADSGNVNGIGILYRFDENGDTLWTRKYTPSTFLHFNCARQTSDKGFVITGMRIVSGIRNYWLMKTDSLGIMEWDTVLGPGYASTIEVTQDGGYIIGGAGGNNLTSARIVKTDSLGNIEWSKNHFGGNSYECFWAAGLASDGGYYIWGCWDTVVQQGDFYLTPVLAKLDSTGNREWTNFYNNPNQLLTAVYQVKELNGHIYLGGERDDGNLVLSRGGWLIKMDLQGNTIWEKIHATPPTGDSTQKLGSNCVYDFELTPDGGVIATGYGFTDIDPGPNYNGNQDIWLLKLDSLGNWYTPPDTTCPPPCDTTGVGELYEADLDVQIFPNPTSSQLHIKIQTPTPNGHISLYSLLGEEVLAQPLTQANTRLDVSTLPPGVYLYQVQVEGQWRTGKVVVE